MVVGNKKQYLKKQGVSSGGGAQSIAKVADIVLGSDASSIEVTGLDTTKRYQYVLRGQFNSGFGSRGIDAEINTVTDKAGYVVSSIQNNGGVLTSPNLSGDNQLVFITPSGKGFYMHGDFSVAGISGLASEQSVVVTFNYFDYVSRIAQGNIVEGNQTILNSIKFIAVGGTFISGTKFEVWEVA